VEDHRPVPLESLYAMKDVGGGDDLTVLPMFREGRDGLEPNREIIKRLDRDRGRRRRYATPRRTEVVAELDRTDRLPAIYFVFSRAGCDEAAAAIRNAGVRLTTREERDTIRERAEAGTAHLGDADLAVLEYGKWLDQLEAGVAAHHAGMVPAFKETVEELFAAGLVKLVFATETLALGINMPARTVVLDKISKFTGDGHDLLLPGEYTQLTGRAGRRGIDVHGYGMVLHSRFVRFDRVAAIAEAGSHAMASSFRPTYNMVVNLIANYPQDRAEELLRASFAQFQQDASLRRLEAAIRRNERKREKARDVAETGSGDIWEYLDLHEAGATRSHKAARAKAAERLKVGDVIEVPSGRRSGRFVIASKRSRDTGVTFEAVSSSGDRTRIRSRDLPPDTEILGRVPVPRPFPPVNPADVRSLGERVADLDPARARRMVQGGAGPLDHPVANDPDASKRVSAAGRVRRLDRELTRQRRRAAHDEAGLVGELHKVQALLDAWEYTDGWSLSETGEVLRVIYSEMDLLVVEIAARALLDDLDPRELGAAVSAFVFDPRADESEAHWPTPQLADRWEDMLDVATDLVDAERRFDLPETRAPEPGFGAYAYHWAAGLELDELLEEDDMAAGDFVRTMRQVIDLLRQLRDARPELRAAASAALTAMDRGVVAAGGIG
jgi:ATP-dependent RNA helicase HelY